MTDDYTLLTPENVELRFDVAGLGSRVAAAAIDYSILAIGYVALSIGGTFLFAFLTRGTALGGTGAGLLAGYLFIAVVVIVTFFGWWGYFILTDMLWNGQSIGKRCLGLRVVRQGGQPVSLTASLVRNLLRIVDGMALIGLLVMIVDSRSRRLGDLAAGTLVIREPRLSLTEDLARAFRPTEIPGATDEAIEAFPDREKLTAAHYALLRDFFARRGRMLPKNADRLASDLATRLAASLGVERAAVGDPVAFLATAARSYEARQRPAD